MERDTREGVELDYKYMVFDDLIDLVLASEISMEEAVTRFKVEIREV